MKRLVSLGVSLGILALIYWQIDVRRLGEAFATSDLVPLLIGVLMVVPITLVTAWRFTLLIPDGAHVGTGESTRLVLATSSLNMVLPSKMGDLAKAWFLRERGAMSGSLALSCVVFEKACDLLSLLAWCVVGLALYPAKDALFWAMTAMVAGGLAVGLTLLRSQRAAHVFFATISRVAPRRVAGALDGLAGDWAAMHAYFWRSGRRLVAITAISLFSWLLHLVQIWLFAVALSPIVPFLANIALAPLAILAGLLPLTFAGIGTRDAALIYFYAPYMAAPAGAALGLLCTLRYILPAVGGLPFLHAYLARVRDARATGAR